MKTTASNEPAALSDYIVANREILGGEPVLRGTRVPVASLFEHLESDCSLDEFLENFPTVTRSAAVAVMTMWSCGSREASCQCRATALN